MVLFRFGSGDKQSGYTSTAMISSGVQVQRLPDIFVGVFVFSCLGFNLTMLFGSGIGGVADE